MFSLRVQKLEEAADTVRRSGEEVGGEAKTLGGAVGETVPGDDGDDGMLEEVRFSSGNPRVESIKGIAHLFRNTAESPGSVEFLPEKRREELCVIAVPSYMTGADFCQFTGSFLRKIVSIRIVRNDAEKERYMVLLKMDSIPSADEFFRHFNGQRFSSLESEICRILFVADVSFVDSAKDATTPPSGQTELPSCPVCLERLDQHISGILTTVCNHSFHSTCISKWADSSCPVCRYCQESPDKSSCSVCGSLDNLWICLICGFVGCGRYAEGHAIRHFQESQHCYSLEVETQRVWDYIGDNYVHRLIQSKTDGKLVELPAPSDLRDDNPHEHKKRCGEGDGEGGGGSDRRRGGGSGCSHIDPDIEEAMMSSKLDSVVYEYNHLLTTQLESQRQYFEGLLEEARAERELAVAEEVERIVGTKMQKLQSRLKRAEEEKEFLRQVNDSLIKNQKQWQEKFAQQERSESELLEKTNAKISDLEEQVRDLMIYIETQRKVESSEDAADIRDGSVVGVGAPQAPKNLRGKGRKR